MSRVLRSKNTLVVEISRGMWCLRRARKNRVTVRENPWVTPAVADLRLIAKSPAKTRSEIPNGADRMTTGGDLEKPVISGAGT